MKNSWALLNMSILLIVTGFVYGCGKSSSSKSNISTRGTRYDNSNYYTSNGNCYSNSGSIVDYSYCSNNSNLNRNFNDPLYGNNTTYGNNLNSNIGLNYNNRNGLNSATMCIGTYYNPYQGSFVPIPCDGYNCSGNMLYNAYGQQVYCQ